MSRLSETLKKHHEFIAFLICGGLTTVVGMGTYFALIWLAELMGIDAYYATRAVAQVVQWVISVLFAYYTNKKWVFRYTEDRTDSEKAKTFVSFFTSRLISLAADTATTFGVLWLLIKIDYKPVLFALWGWDASFSADVWSKIAAAVVTTVLNYVFSKLFVFRKKG